MPVGASLRRHDVHVDHRHVVMRARCSR
jgi:hypothetical protein